MIPSINTIVEDLLAGTITKQQAIAWLNQHAEDAGHDLRDALAAKALGLGSEFFHNLGNGCDTPETVSVAAYQIADAMLLARQSRKGERDEMSP